MSTLENPFRKPINEPGTTDPEQDRALAEQLLGERDAALLGTREPTSETHSHDPLTLTEEEQTALDAAHTAVHERKEAWDKASYVEWAKEIGLGEAWVDETFEFHPDGTVTCPGALDLWRVTTLDSFPPNLTGVGGHLNLGSITTLENVTLPEHVGDDLYLYTLTTLENVTLPEHVGGYLDLWRLTTLENVTWPTNIDGRLYIPRAFQTLAEDLQARGILKGGIEYTA